MNKNDEFTEESFKSLQEEQDRKNKEFLETLSEKDKYKQRIIEDVLKQLVDAGIDDAFLFVGQNTINGIYEHVQYNTQQPFQEYKDGTITESQMLKNMKTNCSLAYGINKFYNMFIPNENRLEEGVKLLYSLSYKQLDHLKNGTEITI
jgi:hypothetical protein